MNPCCLICNTKTGVSVRNASIVLFGEHTNLPSGRKLPEVVSEIIEKPVAKESVHSNIVCKKCCRFCTEYDNLKTKLQEIKTGLKNQFKHSLKSYDITYEDYSDGVKNLSKISDQKEEKKTPKKLVLQASKLQPITPDLLLKVGKLPGVTQAITNTGKMINLKASSGTSTITSVANMSQSKQSDMQENADSEVEEKSFVEEIATVVRSKDDTEPSVKSNLLSFNINNLPKDIFSSVLVSKIESLAEKSNDNDSQDCVEVSQMESIDGQNSMEIDEVFSLSVVPMTTDNGELVLEVEDLKEKPNKNDDEEYIDVSMLAGETSSPVDDKFIFSKLRILNGDQVQVVQDQDHDDDDDDDEDDDGHSNDESQIELQVSGDEETANAIIAAAQESGGAFIKVESGEMFRVKSVQSKSQDECEKAQHQPMQIVAKEGDLFRCLLCERNKAIDNGQECVGGAEAIMRHLKNIHDARTYICQLCGTVMRKRREYTLHIAEHARRVKSEAGGGAGGGGGEVSGGGGKGRVHSCGVCLKAYNSRTLLAEHLHVHSGERPYACHLCDKTFASKYTHQAHLKTHSVRPRPFACNKCGKTFLTQQNLSQHVKTHSGVKDFVCNICGKAFSTQHNLEVHAVVHSGEKPFVCSECGKGFARRAECKDHMRIHTGERPFKCDICGARFTQNSNLHSHKRATHLDDRRYQCEHCPKKFKRRRLLEYHIKATHTGERPLSCKTCGASFVYPEHYKKHVRIHSGERPYVCEICGKSFNSSDNRNTHRFVHSDKKPYECLECGAGYMRKQLLYMHMNTSGHLAESIVVNQPRVTKVLENNNAAQFINIDATSLKFPHETEPMMFEGAEVIKIDPNADTAESNSIPEFIISSGIRQLNPVKTEESETPTYYVSAENMEDPKEIVANDENGGTVRLIQVKLADGNDGWVAVNQCYSNS